MLSSLQSSIPVIGSEGPNALSWSTMTENYQLPANTKLAQDLLFLLALSMGTGEILPKILRQTTDAIPRPLSVISLGDLERSLSTGSWQMSQFLRRARGLALVTTNQSL